MSPPSRWSPDDPSLTPFERELLRAGRGVALSPDVERELWSAIAAKTGGPPGTSGPGGQGSARGRPHVLRWIVGLAIGGAGIVAVTVGVGTGLSSRGVAMSLATPAASDFAVATASTATHAPGGEASAEPPSDRPAATEVDAGAPATRLTATASAPSTRAASGAPEGPPDAGPTSLLAEEAAAVRQARAAVRSGDAAGALRILDAAAARFRPGVLGQEREVLRIEALARSGRTSESSARARAFLRASPESPHAATVRTFAGP